jgi:DNA repair protein RadD
LRQIGLLAANAVCAGRGLVVGVQRRRNSPRTEVITMDLRPYQHNLVDRVREEYRSGARSVLMQLGTGGGKTATASELIARAVDKGRRIIFAAHLDALIDDTSERLFEAGIPHGIVQADRPTNPTAPVQVCSLATLHRRGEAQPADFVIVDECHRAAAPSVRAVLERYPRARLLGLSATPQRGDGQPLGDVFERMVCGPTVAELTEAGHLVPAVVLSPPAPTEGALAMDPVEAYDLHAPGSRALIFCTTVAEAEDVASRLNVPTQTVLGETPRAVRATVRNRVTSGELLVLVGCSAFLEGFDLPAIETIVVARALGTCSAFLQAVGRGLRPSPATGKRECLVLDLTGAAVAHGLPADDRTWSLTGDAVQRSADALAPLARCLGCYAVFHSGPVTCPRCGASTRGARLPRRATRVERQALERLDTRPAWERDELAVRIIVARMPRADRRTGRKLSEAELLARARFAFKKARGRSPERRPDEGGGEAA